MNVLERPFAFLGLVLCAAAVGADCGDNPRNLMRRVNCGFDQDLSLWDFSVVVANGGTVRHVPDDGFPAPDGAAALTFDWVTQFFSACFAIGANRTYDIGMYFKETGSAANATGCTIHLEVYSDASCSIQTNVLFTGMLTEDSRNWTLFNAQVTTQEAGSFGKFRGYCGCGWPGCGFSFDNAFMAEISRVVTGPAESDGSIVRIFKSD
jgi:hypothetical protein